MCTTYVNGVGRRQAEGGRVGKLEKYGIRGKWENVKGWKEGRKRKCSNLRKIWNNRRRRQRSAKKEIKRKRKTMLITGKEKKEKQKRA